MTLHERGSVQAGSRRMSRSSDGGRWRIFLAVCKEKHRGVTKNLCRTVGSLIGLELRVGTN